jgi:hypothetical protein
MVDRYHYLDETGNDAARVADYLKKRKCKK